MDGSRRLDYAAFRREVATSAATLVKHGIERRDRVGIYLPKSAEECTAIFGASAASGVFVPINTLLRPPQVHHIVRDCRIRFLITTADRWDALRDELTEESCLERVLLTDGDPDPGQNRVIARAFSEPSEFEERDSCIGEDLAAILYTSGSTGLPKGVMLSHRNLLAGSRIVSTYLGIRHDERILSVLPFSFDYGLNQLITAVDQGATTVLLTFRFGNEIVKALDAHRITGFAGVPTIWAVLTQAAPLLKKTPLPHLRYVTNSGGAVPSDTIRRLRQTLPHVDLVLMYGLTEAFRSTYLPPDELDSRPTSMGRAIPETEIFLLSEAGERCQPGETGILVHRGPTVSLGYWNRPEETAAVIRPNPLVKPHEGVDPVCISGDLVRMDEDGYFHFVGRNDAMIKCSGYRVSPTEVEEVLMNHGGLAQVAVIGLPDPTAGERVHAVVVAADGKPPPKDDLLSLCARELPAHMVPLDITFRDQLPRSPNGKVDYKGLRREFLEQAGTGR